MLRTISPKKRVDYIRWRLSIQQHLYQLSHSFILWLVLLSILGLLFDDCSRETLHETHKVLVFHTTLASNILDMGWYTLLHGRPLVVQLSNSLLSCSCRACLYNDQLDYQHMSHKKCHLPVEIHWPDLALLEDLLAFPCLFLEHGKLDKRTFLEVQYEKQVHSASDCLRGMPKTREYKELLHQKYSPMRQDHFPGALWKYMRKISTRLIKTLTQPHCGFLPSFPKVKQDLRWPRSECDYFDEPGLEVDLPMWIEMSYACSTSWSCYLKYHHNTTK